MASRQKHIMAESKPFILVLLLASTASSMTLLELEEELEDFVHYQPQQTHLSVNGTNLSKKISSKLFGKSMQRMEPR